MVQLIFCTAAGLQMGVVVSKVAFNMISSAYFLILKGIFQNLLIEPVRID
jgi:accessory gene regulator protein AgrB